MYKEPTFDKLGTSGIDKLIVDFHRLLYSFVDNDTELAKKIRELENRIKELEDNQ